MNQLWIGIIAVVFLLLLLFYTYTWERRFQARHRKPKQAGVPIPWCRAYLEANTQNHVGRCNFDGKFCKLPVYSHYAICPRAR